MKTKILIVSLVILSCGFSQTMLGVELGKKFAGAPEGFEEVQKGFCTGGKFAGQSVTAFAYMTNTEGVVISTFIISREGNFNELLRIYNTYKDAISSKYSNHVPDVVRRAQRGYEFGDGYELQGIKLGHLELATRWFDVNGINIGLTFNATDYTKGTIILVYTIPQDDIDISDDF